MDHNVILGFIYILIFLALYFLPAIIANHRRHRNVNSIAVVDLFLAWTFIGWVLSLAWSLSSNVEAESK